MNQNNDCTSLNPKRKVKIFRIGFLSVMLCLGLQSALANLKINVGVVTSETVQATVTGTVLDENGAPLPGASVVVKGTTIGTQTDFDGNYTITADDDAVLVFSYIGYAPQEISVNGQSTINVSMVEDAALLSEVVVLGYASQTRGDLTGAVSSVDISEATKAPIVNAAEALQGRVTGVSVINSGNPGAAPKINIRGFGSTNNTNPLFIIDGVQTDDASVLNSINPNDIEQMNVLKDGAAAIYGARAANGVVIVTTKGGGYNMEKAVISLDMYTGFSQATNVPELLNAQQHGDMLFQSAANDGETDFSHPQYGNGPTAVVPATLSGYTRVVSYDPIVSGPASATVTPGGTDWMDAILRTAPTQNISMSLQNGGETGKYFLSAGYLNRDGVLNSTGFKQGITRLNSEFKLGNNITIGEHLSATFSNTTGLQGGAQVNEALRMSPLTPLFDDDGFYGGSKNSIGTSNPRNPAAQLDRGSDNFNKLLRVFGDVYLAAELFDGFIFKTTLAGRIESNNQRRFLALDPEHGEPLSTNTLTEQNNNGFNWTWTNTANYNNSFGEHNLNVLVGIEALSENNKGGSLSRNGYAFETPDFYLLSNGTGGPVIVNFAYDNTNTLYSLFGTANYNYAGKYFLTGTLRRDTSSRFSRETRTQTFPSISAGWLLSNETFFPQDGFLSRTKLKASWGELGNQTLPVPNPDQNILVQDENQAFYPISGNSVAIGAVLRAFGNPNLRWETTESLNVGVELGFFDNALTVDFDYFDIKTKDLITLDVGESTTTSLDASAQYTNLGDVSNKGFDLAVGYQNQSESGFSYGVSANISKYNNEVEALAGDFLSGSSYRPGVLTRTQVGRPISSFYGLQVTGFDDNGRFTYADLDNSGDVSDDDRDFIGSPHPDFTYGFNLNLGYKGFDLSLFINGSVGNDIYNYEKIFTDFPTFVNGNRSVRVLDSWTPTNTNASLPALSLGGQNETAPSSFFVEDGSFLRLRNLQVGYSLPDQIIDKLGMSSLRLYVQGSNLFTITGYDGLDPEINTTQVPGVNDVNSSQLNLGIDDRIYPLARIFTFGINVKI